MKLNYHYHTVKTLAHYAGFDDRAAQIIAYFSQYVDEYIARQPFVIDKKPPDFFLDNKLAVELCKGKWVFLPCPTGVNIANSSSHNYQIHTLMPFHFIMPAPYKEATSSAGRASYRCVTAEQGDKLLINRLIKNASGNVDANDQSSLVALGMLLHTFADTYSHGGFSAFHGWENQSYVSIVTYNSPSKQIPFPVIRLLVWLRKKITGIERIDNAIRPMVAVALARLPSIGHANVGTWVDLCECVTTFCNKDSESGKMKPIRRDMTEYMGGCSRRILNILCEANGRPPIDDDKWEAIRDKIADAHTVWDQGNSRLNKRIWSKKFPEISYNYKKNQFIRIKLETLKYDKELMEELSAVSDIKKGSLAEIYSERKAVKGLMAASDVNIRDLKNVNSDKPDTVRAAIPMSAKNVDDLFFTFSELAYRHVHQATGEYASKWDIEHLPEYCKLVSSHKRYPIFYL